MSKKMVATSWDEGTTKTEVSKRLKNAMEARRLFEDKWLVAERTIYSTAGLVSPDSILEGSGDHVFQTGLPGLDGASVEMNAAYTFKNIRFIHAQMSANPPAVAMKPTTSDQDDRRKADAADKLSRWALRKYSMQELSDQRSLSALVYGTGFLKFLFDSSRGDIIGFDEKTGELELEGDIAGSAPFIWNIFLDPDAKAWSDCKYVFERVFVDYNEACVRWPERQETLKKALITKGDDASLSDNRDSGLRAGFYNCVELFEYWETGLPSNGYLGRFTITTREGDVIEECRPSPCRFKRAGSVTKVETSLKIPDELKERAIEALPEQAQLPYSILTDIDVPNCIYGKSAIDYASNLQENLTRLDSSVLDNIAVHSSLKLVLPDGTDVADESLSNDTMDVVKITGNQPPYYMEVPSLMPEMTSTRQNLINGINDVMGVNESMFGQQSREQSGASMQYATNQGNMIRRRLFNKYVMAVEADYRLILNYIRKHWSIARTINVLGKEKALEAVDIKGADIDGGYDIVGEYGVTLSLDPITRRQEIMAMMPMFKEAGIPARKALELMKLNELEGMFDRLEYAGLRQKEVFDVMIATKSYVPPEELQDHENMIAWAMDYFMSQEFNSLDPLVKQLCKQHIKDRSALAAQEKPAPAAAPAAPTELPPPPAQQMPVA